MGVRPPAGLHRGDLLRVIDVADVEDPHAAEPRRHHRVPHALATLGPAVDPPVRHLDREEQQVAPDRRIALSAGAWIRQPKRGSGRGGNVPDLEAVEVPLEDEVPPEGQIGVHVEEIAGTGRVFERRGLPGGRHQLEPAERHPGVVEAGLQADPGILADRLLLDAERMGLGRVLGSQRRQALGRQHADTEGQHDTTGHRIHGNVSPGLSRATV